MTARDFVYWLQGYFELQPGRASLDADQVDTIRRHIALVFKHEIDPSAGPPAHQAALDEIHAGAKPEPAKPHPQIGGTGPGGLVYRC